MLEGSHPRSLRASSGDILKAERGVASCGERLVTAGLGRPGKSPARHYDLAARSSLHGAGGNCPPSQSYGGLAQGPPKRQRRRMPAVVGRRAPEETEARPRGPKPPRWSADPPSPRLWRAAHLPAEASAKAGRRASRVISAFTRVFDAR